MTTKSSQYENIMQKYPNKIPIIVNKYDDKDDLPEINKTKYLVEKNMKFTNFVYIIRKRIKLNSGDTLYIKPFAEYRITKKNYKILAMKIIGKINKEVIDELKSISSKNIKKIILEKNQWFKK